MYRTSIYRSWALMRNRCNNKRNADYNNYGGRGIKVCDRWLKYENFLSDMYKKPKDAILSRINSNGDYEPYNVKWISTKPIS